MPSSPFSFILPKEFSIAEFRSLASADLWERDSQQATILALRRSGSFDETAYLEANPDVRENGMGAIEHYVRYGIEENRNIRCIPPVHCLSIDPGLAKISQDTRLKYTKYPNELLKKILQFSKEGQYNKALSCYELFKIIYKDIAEIFTVKERLLPKKDSFANDNSTIIMEIPIYNNYDYLIEKFFEIIEFSPYDVKIDIILDCAENSFLIAQFDSTCISPNSVLNRHNTNPQQLLMSFFKHTPFFDFDFYQKQYQIIFDNEDPLSHFSRVGFADGKLPARWFDIHIGKTPKITSILKKKQEKQRLVMTPEPKVSIIVPVFNNSAYLKECINSIRHQTLQDIEIIIINDGSTDKKSIEIMTRFAKEDNRIRLIHKKNTGYGHTMNCGLLAAKGEYIGIVESDDYILDSMYEKMFSIAKEKDVYFVKCNSMRFYGEGSERTFEKLVTVKEKAHYNTILNTHTNPLLLKMYNINTNSIFKRKFLYDNCIKFNETPGASFQDNGFWFQTFIFGTKFYCIPDFLYMIRRDNPNSSVLSKEKVFCIRDEYLFIQNILDKKKNLKKLFIKMFYWKKYGNYLFSLNRIDGKYKRYFLETFASEFNDAYSKGYLDKDIFAEQWDNLMEIISKAKNK